MGPYTWAIDRIFLEKKHSHLIIAEDDMLFSPDFVAYFKQTAVLLDRDPTLWCVSSWNDNGMAAIAKEERCRLNQ
jgi:alpha-1,3-mannosyl-glycoprotein beta-1,2-N-acetylglucosaminyltransferase